MKQQQNSTVTNASLNRPCTLIQLSNVSSISYVSYLKSICYGKNQIIIECIAIEKC